MLCLDISRARTDRPVVVIEIVISPDRRCALNVRY